MQAPVKQDHLSEIIKLLKTSLCNSSDIYDFGDNYVYVLILATEPNPLREINRFGNHINNTLSGTNLNSQLKAINVGGKSIVTTSIGYPMASISEALYDDHYK